MEHLLKNIGAGDRVSKGDLQTIFQEVGNESGEIPADRFVKMF